MRARLRDLLLGARLVFAGGRDGLLRTTFIAVGIGLGVAVMLGAAAIGPMIEARADRTDGRSYELFRYPALEQGPNTLLISSYDTIYHDIVVQGWRLQPEGAAAPVPPGLDALPKPGEMVVSPKLRALLAEEELLRERLDHPIVGTIADKGLSGPGEYSFYLGADGLDHHGFAGTRIDHFGEQSSNDIDPALILLMLVAFTVLLLPIGIFTATTIRFGGEQRDRRLAALRLIGADQAMARRIAAGEAFVAALCGLVIGALFFLAGRQLVEGITLQRISVFAADIVPVPALAALIAILVPATAVAVALFALRRVSIEPLGVARNSGTPTRRRLWWRLLLPALGVGGLLTANFDPESSQIRDEQLVASVLLLLIGVAALLPWLVDAVVARLGAGPVAWQLAVRRLQLHSDTAARTVSGVTVAVAGGLALQTLFAGLAGTYQAETGSDLRRAGMSVQVWHSADARMIDTLVTRLREAPGVTAATAVLRADLAYQPRSGEETYATLLIGDCAALGQYAQLPRCADGDAFAARTETDDPSQRLPAARTPVRITHSEDGTDWRVPAVLTDVPAVAAPDGTRAPALLLTPRAAGLDGLGGLHAQAFAKLDPADPDAIERVRNIALDVHPAFVADELTAYRTDRTFDQIRRGILIGVVALLTLLGAGLLVTMLEQLRERRRLLAALVAFGTRRRTLGASLLWQTAIPMLLGLGLAVLTGGLLGAVLLRLVQQPVRLDWGAVATMTGLSAGVVLLVTALSLPLLWRLLRPGGLRTE